MTLGRRRVVRVPASSANLGPGFDVLAAAVALHLELEVVETGSFAVVTSLAVPTDRSNLVCSHRCQAATASSSDNQCWPRASFRPARVGKRGSPT